MLASWFGHRFAFAVAGETVRTPGWPAAPLGLPPNNYVPDDLHTARQHPEFAYQGHLAVLGAEVRWVRHHNLRLSVRGAAKEWGVSVNTLRAVEESWRGFNPMLTTLAVLGAAIGRKLVLEPLDAPWRVMPWEE
jgi:hypothetical protein